MCVSVCVCVCVGIGLVIAQDNFSSWLRKGERSSSTQWSTEYTQSEDDQAVISQLGVSTLSLILSAEKQLYLETHIRLKRGEVS